MSTAESMGKVVRARREAAAVSQQELARRAGLNSQMAVWAVESGNRGLKFVEAVGLSRALNFSLDELAECVPDVEAAACRACDGRPPKGFTCNTCRVVGR